jgi:hypothetical protein
LLVFRRIAVSTGFPGTNSKAVMFATAPVGDGAARFQG